MTSAGLLFVVSAPSGAGKTSLVKALTERTERIGVSISHTTRPMRPGEADGVNYHFIDNPQFEAMIEADAFIEHAQVFGHYYGTSVAGVEQALASGVDVVLEIDWQGAAQVRQHFEDAISIFILPPSRATLEQRLRDRGQDQDDVIQRRLSQAVEEMSHHREFDYLVVNDRFEQAVGELMSIVNAERLRLNAQEARIAPLVDELLKP